MTKTYSILDDIKMLSYRSELYDVQLADSTQCFAGSLKPCLALTLYADRQNPGPVVTLLLWDKLLNKVNLAHLYTQKTSDLLTALLHADLVSIDNVMLTVTSFDVSKFHSVEAADCLEATYNPTGSRRLGYSYADLTGDANHVIVYETAQTFDSKEEVE